MERAKLTISNDVADSDLSSSKDGVNGTLSLQETKEILQLPLTRLRRKSAHVQP